MRILLDNCVNARFARFLPGHEVVHARRMDWEALSNGRLLKAGEESGFRVLITVDKNIDHQQSLRGRRICLVTLDVKSITLEGLRTIIGPTLGALRRIEAEGIEGGSLLLVPDV